VRRILLDTNAYGAFMAGTPIPINDVWLAAQAMETGSVVVTFDEHLHRVQGIRIWDATPRGPAAG